MAVNTSCHGCFTPQIRSSSAFKMMGTCYLRACIYFLWDYYFYPGVRLRNLLNILFNSCGLCYEAIKWPTKHFPLMHSSVLSVS